MCYIHVSVGVRALCDRMGSSLCDHACLIPVVVLLIGCACV